MNDRPNISNINTRISNLQAPPGMGNMQAWLCWRLEKKAGSDKPAKVPYYVSGERRRGKQGTTEDREKLVTFEAAKAAAIRKGFTGVGFAVLPGSSVVALDFDDVVQDPNMLKSVLRAVENTYAEFSPSGNGIRAFILQGNDFNGFPVFKDLKSHKKSGHPFTFEVFANSGFVTFTGNIVSHDHDA